MSNEEIIWGYLYAWLGNAYGAAGLMGNLFAESGLNPKNLQNSFEKKLGFTDETYTASVDNGSYKNFIHDSAGYGLAQWTFWSRKQNLLAFAKEQMVSIGSLEMQLGFLVKELTERPAILTALRTATSVRAASDLILTQYEQPADQGEAVKVKRAAYGQGYYDKYAGAKGGITMGIRIGHASRPEGSGVNGKAGDQTGKEVCIREWYGPWDYVAIHPDANVRERHACACEAGCKNDHIGYSQFGATNRNTLNAQAVVVGYDLARIKNDCNTDCSAFQNVCAVASKAPGVTYGSNGWTTSSMKAALQKAGYKIVTDKAYLSNSAYCIRGAIYVKTGHTVCGLDNGAKASQVLAAAGLTGATPKKETPAKETPASAAGTDQSAKLDYAKSKDSALAGAYKTTSDLHLRAGAGKSKKSLTVMPKGSTVHNYGYYTAVDGVKWLYVKYGSLTGFCSSSYLTRI